MNRRSTMLTYVLWFFFGFLGIHRFYLGHVGWGIAYLLTAAFGGIGWLIDLFLIPGYVEKYNAPGARALRQAEKLRLAKRASRR